MMMRRRGRRARNRSRARLLVPIALLGVVLTAVLAGCSTPEQTASAQPKGGIEISAPDSVLAGEPYAVEVRSSVGELASLAVDAGYGPVVLEQQLIDGVASFEVPEGAVAGSGVVRLDTRVGSVRAQTTIDVLPGPSVNPLALFLGPRTVLADGVDYSMVVAVPVDRLGNPTADGTEVSFTINRPSSSSSDEAVLTSGLLAYLRIVGGTTAGRTTVAGSVDAIDGPEQSFLQVAGLTAGFELSVVSELPSADGSTLFEVETGHLVDRFDNQLPDGTLVSLDLELSTGGSRRLWSSTIDGKAIFVIEAPPAPVAMSLVALASGGVSEELLLRFEPAVARLMVKATEQVDADEPTWLIEIGPVVSNRGAYVADGTPADVTIDGVTTTVRLENGKGSIAVGSQPALVDVTVLGVSATVGVDP